MSLPLSQSSDLDTSNDCGVENCKCQVSACEGQFIKNCQCIKHAESKTQYMVYRTNKELPPPIPVSVYDPENLEHQYHYMDTHYAFAREMIDDHLKGLMKTPEGTAKISDVPSSLAFDPSMVICELSDDATLAITDLRRKYYLMFQEFEQVLDVLPEWIPIPFSPPTNSEVIIWLSSVLDVMSEVFINLTVSGRATSHGKNITINELKTEDIDVGDNAIFNYRSQYEKNPPCVAPVSCTAVFGNCPYYAEVLPTNFGLVCDVCIVGSAIPVPSDRNLIMVECDKCGSKYPMSPLHGSGTSISVLAHIVNHERLSLVSLSRKETVRGDRLSQRLYAVYDFMKRGHSDCLLYDDDPYYALFYYAERNLVHQFKVFRALVSALRRMRNAMIAIGFNYKTREESGREVNAEAMNRYHYLNQGPNIYHYCSSTSKYLGPVDADRCPSVGDRDCINCLCTQAPYFMASPGHECRVEEKYNALFKNMYTLTGRYKKVKAAFRGAPPCKKRKYD